jgi:hypothetical protein
MWTVGEAIEWFHAEEARMLEAVATAIVKYVSACHELADRAEVADGESTRRPYDGAMH